MCAHGLVYVFEDVHSLCSKCECVLKVVNVCSRMCICVQSVNVCSRMCICVRGCA
jgi:hypothetical protein